MTPRPITEIRTATTQSDAGPSLRTAWSRAVDPLDEASTSVTQAWKRLTEALLREDFPAASDALDAARRGALEESDGGESELLRRIDAGRVAIDLALGRSVEIEHVRGLLAAAESLATTALSAYQLGRMFELRREWKKGLFYARAALTAAKSAGRPPWIAVNQNLVGNLLLAQSYFDEAAHHYRASLGTEAGNPLERAQASDNLAFALMAQGHTQQARPYLGRALATLRKVEGPARLSIELDLALLHLLEDRPQRAIHYASMASIRADNLKDDRSRSNALLLLTHGARETNNTFLARRCNQELTDIYDAEFAAALSTFDVLELVSLKA